MAASERAAGTHIVGCTRIGASQQILLCQAFRHVRMWKNLIAVAGIRAGKGEIVVAGGKIWIEGNRAQTRQNCFYNQ